MVDALEKLLPDFDFSERHERVVFAPHARVYEAARNLRVRQVPLLRLLMAIRWLPGMVTGRRRLLSPQAMALDEAVNLGFTLAWEEPDRGYAFVGVGRYWVPNSGIRPIAGVEDFLSFSEAGYAKVALAVVAEPEGSNRTRVITETRIRATDAAARRRFGAYWLIIRPGSAAIRRALLRAIAMAAEAQGAPTESPGTA
ncbi:MAG: hypothetical protein AUG48_01725 [Actinobacteria bacterium 13_1_20CM_3_68_9]|nr:MAG: hypothetical protein AUG48_01725 [Actinobacteria bacterium 13_1_20CM_3_68_9]